MMAGNPNHWWSMYPQLSSPSHQFVDSSTNEDQNPNQDFPIRSWSQLLLGGGEEDKFGASIFQQEKKLENWEDQVLLNLSSPPAISYTSTTSRFPVVDVKQEALPAAASQILQNHPHHQQFYHHAHKPSTSSCSSITTTLISNNFSGGLTTSTPPPAALTELLEGKINNHHHHSSQCNSSGGVSKKARVQQSSAQQPAALKVSKEKVRDRITTLHQIVSPFGKTDTASVLSESIGCIRILQAQIEALSSPYMRHASESTGHHQHSFLNHEIDMDGRGASKQDSLEGQGAKNLRSLGLCLVPISFIQLAGDDNGADYWSPPATLGGGF